MTMFNNKDPKYTVVGIDLPSLTEQAHKGSTTEVVLSACILVSHKGASYNIRGYDDPDEGNFGTLAISKRTRNISYHCTSVGYEFRIPMIEYAEKLSSDGRVHRGVAMDKDDNIYVLCKRINDNKTVDTVVIKFSGDFAIKPRLTLLPVFGFVRLSEQDGSVPTNWLDIGYDSTTNSMVLVGENEYEHGSMLATFTNKLTMFDEGEELPDGAEAW